jgi:hypothetical protein
MREEKRGDPIDWGNIGISTRLFIQDPNPTVKKTRRRVEEGKEKGADRETKAEGVEDKNMNITKRDNFDQPKEEKGNEGCKARGQ